MKEINTLVIIESPLQLINANEYIREHSLECSTKYYVISSRDKSNLSQLKRTYEALDIKNNIKIIGVTDIDKSVLTRLKYYFKILKVAKGESKNIIYDRVLVGHIKSNYQLILLNSVKCNKAIYLDDGTSTFYEQEVLKKKKIKSFSSPFKRFFPQILGLNAKIKYNKGVLSFYTMYKEVIDKNHGYIDYQYNCLNYLKNKYRSKKIDPNIIFFIGTPFYWKNDNSSNVAEIFKEINRFFKGKRIIYFPHRYEPEEHLILAKQFNWLIKKPELPIELALITESCLPKNFAMFTSSAFFSINGLIPNGCFYSFELKKLDSLLNSKNIFNIYRKYDGIDNIEVIKLSN